MDIALELLRAIGRLFLNPLLYIAIFMLIFLGYQRVKRERRFFKVRILGGWTELRLGISTLLLSLIISVITVVVGIALPIQFLAVLMLLSIIFLLAQLHKLLSPVILFILATFVLIVLHMNNLQFSILDFEVAGLTFTAREIVSITLIAGVLLIAEALLIRKHAVEIASPVLERTKRGGRAVAYLSKGFWILPVFIVVPGDIIPQIAPYFPQFGLGEEAFSLIVFPFIVGFKHMTRQTLPINVYPQYSKGLLVLGQILIIGGIAGYFDTLIASITLVVGTVLRIVMLIVVNIEQRKEQYAVVAKSTGTMIAEVLPNSPAEKMGLQAGEVIKRVNGKDVFNERELYEALQINAALCKLEVLDHQGELRLTQHVVHREDHHRIGVLLAE
jgi:hypothetical protein